MSIEIVVYPALDQLGRRIEGHYDVWLDGDPLLKAVPDPLEATRKRLVAQAIVPNGIVVKPKVEPRG